MRNEVGHGPIDPLRTVWLRGMLVAGLLSSG